MYITILVKQVYWYISQVSGERLQDHWSPGFPPEAPQQEPGEILVPVFHTRPYHAVPECVTLAQREACLVCGLPSP